MAARVHQEVIDLVGSSSDDEDDAAALPIPQRAMRHVQIEDADDGEDEVPARTLPMAGAFPAEPLNTAEYTAPDVAERRVDGGTVFVIDGEEIFIPDEQAAVSAHTPATAATQDATAGAALDTPFTVDDCLQHVLEIFPDICPDHVRALWTSFEVEGDYEVLAGRARLDNIVEQLVSSTSYPKQVKGKLKRKREDSDAEPLDIKKWESPDRAVVPGWAKGSIAAICKADFPIIPRNHIATRLATHKFLFPTYVALAKDVDDSEDGTHVFGRGRAAKVTTADADTIALNCGHVELVAELAAARLHVVANRTEREAAKAKKRAEEENLQNAIAAGETAECSACFDDLPMNRQIHCDGSSTHFTCFECAETYIKSEVGDARCKVLCPAGCGAGFAHSQLNLLDDKKLLEKLAQIQQEQDIRDAGLEDLESCPFCDYKVIMPPVDEDFEFRCANPECERVSCRRCKAISHVPITCEQHAKDNKISSRHQIEEAMTAALVRSCVKCKKVFIKESGCNKMSCGSCGTLQCYVCSAVIKDYNHFDQGSGRRTVSGTQTKKCPLYDDVEERHEREVKEAEEKARAEVVKNNPDVSAEDLEIKVSEAVKKSEKDRIQRLGGAHGLHHPLDHAALREQARRLADEGFDDGDDDAFDDMENFIGQLGAARHRAQARGEEANRDRELHRRFGPFDARQGRPVMGRVADRAGGDPFYNARPPANEPVPVDFGLGGIDRRPRYLQPARQPAQPLAAQDFDLFADLRGDMFDGAADPPDREAARSGNPAANDNAPPGNNYFGGQYYAQPLFGLGMNGPYAMPGAFDAPIPPAPRPGAGAQQPAQYLANYYDRFGVFGQQDNIFEDAAQAERRREAAEQRHEAMLREQQQQLQRARHQVQLTRERMQRRHDELRLQIQQQRDRTHGLEAGERGRRPY